MTHLTKVQEAIAKAVPGIKVMDCGSPCHCNVERIRPITLEDVLRAMDNVCLLRDSIGMVSTSGVFFEDTEDGLLRMDEDSMHGKWTLGLPLDQQPEDVIEFLYQILVDNE